MSSWGYATGVIWMSYGVGNFVLSPFLTLRDARRLMERDASLTDLNQRIFILLRNFMRLSLALGDVHAGLVIMQSVERESDWDAVLRGGRSFLPFFFQAAISEGINLAILTRIFSRSLMGDPEDQNNN